MSGRWKLGQAGWICILLVVAVWAVYLPVVGFEFTNYDDPDYVTKNPPVRAGLKWESVVWAFTHSHSANWHPLTWLSHMVDCQLFGLRPGGHHLTNLLLHTANTLLLFGLLQSLTGAVWRSGLVAALFGLHPTHVESVAWVAERKDVLSTCFGLVALWAYAVYARGSRREDALIKFDTHLAENDQSLLTSAATRRWYVLSLVCYVLGLMSKPMLVTLPFVMLLLDYWPLGRFTKGKSHWRGRLVEKLPFFALAAASCAVTVIVQEAHKAVSSLAQSPLGFRLANAAISYVLYLGKLIWPTRLAVIYPEIHNWPVHTVVLALIFLGIITSLVCWQRERRPWLLMGWLWFVGMLVPVIGIVKVGSHQITDRYTYLPSIGFFIIVVWGTAELLGSPAAVWPRRILSGAAILLCMALTQAQVMQWRNTETLFRHALSVTTGNWGAYASLAFDLVSKKERAEAQECLLAALKISPFYEPGWTMLATLAVEDGRLEEGVGYCQKALSIDPNSAGAHSTWGLALSRQGQTNEAMAHYEKALQCDPNCADAHYNLGNALANQGQIAAAREHYEKAIQADPYSADYHKADYHNNLAYMLVREGKLDRAVNEFQAAVEMDPESWHARYGLGDALVRQGQYAQGAAQLEQVLQIQPELASARLQYGIALAAQGQVSRAIAAFSEAVRRKPDFALAHYHLGRLLDETGKAGEAAQHYRETVKLAPNFADALNRLAWLLSVSPDAALRNGPEAVELAERACKISNNAQPAMVRTLAAAYAEVGRFDDAVKTAEKACGSMAAAPREEQQCRQMLERFRVGQPWREGPK